MLCEMQQCLDNQGSTRLSGCLELRPLHDAQGALLDDEDDGDLNKDGQPRLHRAVYPRDFGRQNAKDIERRDVTVLS